MLIVIGGGFLIALTVAMLVQATLGGKPDETKIEVLVAARSMTTGAEVKPMDVRWQAWPEAAMIPNAIIRQENQKIEDVAKGRLKRDVSAGEPIVQQALTGDGKGNILANMLDPGKRAIAIKVSAESMVGGFISPGDRVDVVLTHQVRINDSARDAARSIIDRHATETVLENVKILAVDQMARKDGDEAKVGRTVTLEVDGSQAEKVALAGAMGDLSLTLRGLSDASAVSDVPPAPTTDVQVSAVLQQVAEVTRDSNGAGNMVRVYSRDTIVNVPVRR
ncbi:MAG: Flp pilus assembly protein CpaB [Pseudomonadota bacterium]